MQGFTEDFGRRFARFMRLWERICKDFMTHCREDLRGFASIQETLGQDSQVFVRIWERIRKDLQGFGRGFARICKTLLE